MQLLEWDVVAQMEHRPKKQITADTVAIVCDNATRLEIHETKIQLWRMLEPKMEG